MQQKTGHAVIDLFIDLSIVVVAIFSKFIIFSKIVVGACLMAMNLHDFTEFTDAIRSVLSLGAAVLGFLLILKRYRRVGKTKEESKP